MKTLIRQWLCEHNETTWVSTTTHTVESISNPVPKTTFIESWYMCEKCKKFIKLDTGKLLKEIK